MDRTRAVEQYLKKNKTALDVVKRLMRWDEGATMVQNAKKLDIAVDAARTFQARYCIDYKRKRSSGVRRMHAKLQAYLDLWEKGWVQRDIAKAFNVTHQAVSDGIRRAQEKRTKK